MTTNKIDWTKPVRFIDPERRNDSIRVLCIDVKGTKYCVLALEEINGEEYPITLTIDGRFRSEDSLQCVENLPTEVDFYIDTKTFLDIKNKNRKFIFVTYNVCTRVGDMLRIRINENEYIRCEINYISSEPVYYDGVRCFSVGFK